MQVWLDYHLQKRRFVSIFFVPHSRPKFGILPVWQNHLCLHQWNTDGELLQQNASTEYKSARNKAKQLYNAF
jgi:hypothetical protein